MKRIAIATLFGVAAGVICATLAAWGHLLTLTSVLAIWILLNRAVMGFAIGTSGLKLHWAWNGIVMGLLVGSIFSYFLFMNGGNGDAVQLHRQCGIRLADRVLHHSRTQAGSVSSIAPGAASRRRIAGLRVGNLGIENRFSIPPKAGEKNHRLPSRNDTSSHSPSGTEAGEKSPPSSARTLKER